MNHRYLLLGLLVLVPACATMPTTYAAGERSQYHVLSGKDLQHANTVSALDVIRMLQPHFLHRGGPQRLDAPVIFVDGVRAGDAQALAAIPKEAVAEIRYLTTSEASFRYGPGLPAGAVVVTLNHNWLRGR